MNEVNLRNYNKEPSKAIEKFVDKSGRTFIRTEHTEIVDPELWLYKLKFGKDPIDGSRNYPLVDEEIVDRSKGTVYVVDRVSINNKDFRESTSGKNSKIVGLVYLSKS